MIDTTNEIRCKHCGKPVPQIAGHRRREYCNDTCKQIAYRRRKEHPHHDVTIVDDSLQQRIAELEQEVKTHRQNALACHEKLDQAQRRISKLEQQVEVQRQQLGQYYQQVHNGSPLQQEVQRLQAQLDIEQRFRTDTQVHHFKSWLRTHRPGGTDFASRFLDDRRLPPEASRAHYEGLLRLYKYSDEDIFLFRELWKDMLFFRQQS